MTDLKNYVVVYQDEKGDCGYPGFYATKAEAERAASDGLAKAREQGAISVQVRNVRSGEVVSRLNAKGP